MARRAIQLVSLVLLLMSVVCYLYYRISNLTSDERSTTAHPLEFGSFDNEDEPMRILVTGGAGFIGFHLAKTLASHPGNLVIALDNFNDYYDVTLKIDRAFELYNLGVIVINDDVCNTALLREIFSQYNLTHVAHMAAQAGVRYSLQNPLAYIRANVECQVALLDVLQDYSYLKLVYASSSSVYGKKSQIPFSLSANTFQPGNMYAATKKTDELLAYHYCLAYNISAVGLRFFTVYGPWGRPDMAVFKFAEHILDGKDVPMYHAGNDAGDLGRDFTYIDDVISGVMSALRFRPSLCGQQYNLGFGNPVSLPSMVDYLQEELGTAAHVNKLPLPPTEILRTWADISVSTQVLGFQPTTDIKQGLKRFVVWYRGYRRLRKDQDLLGLPSKAEDWFNKLETERQARYVRYEKQAIEDHNQRLQNRLAHERLKYREWAKTKGISLPELNKGSFTLHQGMDSPGGDIMRINSLKNNIEGLKSKCQDIDHCIAFNSEGVLKSKVGLSKKWDKVPFFTEAKQGLYVASVDLCEADLDDCSKYANCIPMLPAHFSCKCKSGFYGNGKLCLPRFGSAPTEELEWEYAADRFSIYNVKDMKDGVEMVFFQGLDSSGGDYLVADQFAGDADKLKSICKQDPLCIAVNTNGLMKRRLNNKDQWARWTQDSKHGMYVFDINYCLLSEEACPDDSHCTRVAPADYRCQCHAPLVLAAGKCVNAPISPTATQIQQPSERPSSVPTPGKIKPYVQQATDKPDVQQAKGKPDVQQAQDKPSGVQQAKDKPSDVQQAQDKPSDVQQAKDKPSDVQQAKDKPSDVQQAKDKPSDVQQAKDKPDVQQAKDKPSDVQQAKNKPDVQQAKDKPDVQQAKDKPDVQQAKGKPADVQQAKDKPSDLLQAKDKPSDLLQAKDKPNVEEANHGTEVVLKTNEADKSETQERVLHNPHQNRESVNDLDLVESEGHKGPLGTHTENDRRDLAHIIVSVDANDYAGLPAFLNSVGTHSSGHVMAHLVSCEVETPEIQSYLACFKIHAAVTVAHHQFPVGWLDQSYRAYMEKQAGKTFGYLSSCANYARFFFHRLLPDVDRAVYFDSDTIIQGDIMELWSMTAHHHSVISAVPRHTSTYKTFFGPQVANIYEKRHGRPLNLDDGTFNAGVFHIDLTAWRNQSVLLDKEVQFWMDKQVELGGLWRMGTQPPMLLLFYAAWEELPGRWNVEGLGWRTDIPQQLIEGAALLHWNGISKPWRDRNNPYHKYWARLLPPECTEGHVCVPREQMTEKEGYKHWECVSKPTSQQTK